MPILIGFGLGVFLEFGQVFLPDRTADVSDAISAAAAPDWVWHYGVGAKRHALRRWGRRDTGCGSEAVAKDEPVSRHLARRRAFYYTLRTGASGVLRTMERVTASALLNR